MQTGPQWDFGGRPLSPKDELDAGTPRIAFGFDPEVYRPWRRFRNGQWEFGLSPALQRAVPKGAPVHTVTGGYKITITDGVTTEVYGDTAALPVPQPAVVTYHDLLTQLASSALVEVAGVVAADRTVGGQAAVDVPLRTSAWLLGLGGAVTLAGVGVPPAAPTQTVTVRCINAVTVGAIQDRDVRRLQALVAGFVERDKRLKVASTLAENTARVLHELRPRRFPDSVMDPLTYKLLNPEPFVP